MIYTPDALVDFDGANQSIADHALDYGIPANRIIMRLNAGWTVEKAITRPVVVYCLTATALTRPIKRRRRRHHQGTNRINVTIEGQTDSVLGWCSRFNISRSTVENRVQRGMTYEQALTIPTSTPQCNRLLTLDGRTWTIKAWATELGVTYQAIILRLKAGWPVERALTVGKSTTTATETSGKAPGVVEVQAEKQRDRRGSVARDSGNYEISGASE